MTRIGKTYHFFKENDINQEFTLTEEELHDKFRIYLTKKPRVWVEHYSFNPRLITTDFVGTVQGLNSVTEEDYSELDIVIDPILAEYLQNVQQVA